jgi:hypothetical protein
LKTPQFPIWVVCSESHYSVLFALRRDAAAACVDSKVQLYYYDELANQMEVIKLSVDNTRGDADPPEVDDDLEPPLNDVVRTRWGKLSHVDWNGSEPIL